MRHTHSITNKNRVQRRHARRNAKSRADDFRRRQKRRDIFIARDEWNRARQEALRRRGMTFSRRRWARL